MQKVALRCHPTILEPPIFPSASTEERAGFHGVKPASEPITHESRAVLIR